MRRLWRYLVRAWPISWSEEPLTKEDLKPLREALEDLRKATNSLNDAVRHSRAEFK